MIMSFTEGEKLIQTNLAADKRVTATLLNDKSNVIKSFFKSWFHFTATPRHDYNQHYQQIT